MTEDGSYQFTCDVGGHQVSITASNRDYAESLVRERGWLKTRSGWVCERHRDRSRDPGGTWSPTSGATIYSPLGDHVDRIRVIAVLREWNEVRVEYEHERLTEGDPADYGHWVSARDDVGTEYDHTGGGAGVRPDGRTVEGEFDIRPAPPPEASWFELIFHWYANVAGADFPPYALRVPLPLPEVRFEEWVEMTRRYWMREESDDE